MPINHRLHTDAPDVGGPQTVKPSNWNDTLIGTGGADGLPLVRRLAHADGMDFAATASEVLTALDTYSADEVDTLLASQPDLLPPGGTLDQVLAKASASDFDLKWMTVESGTPLLPNNVALQGLDTTGAPHALIQLNNSDDVIVGDGASPIWLWGDTSLSGALILPNNVALKSYKADGTTVADLLKLDAKNQLRITAPTTGLSPGDPLDRPVIYAGGQIEVQPFLYSNGWSYSQLFVHNTGEAGGSTQEANLYVRARDKSAIVLARTGGSPPITWVQQIHPNGSWVIGNGWNTENWSLALSYAGDRSASVAGPLNANSNLGVGGNLNVSGTAYFAGGADHKVNGWQTFMHGSGDGWLYMCRNANTNFNDQGGTSVFRREMEVNGTFRAHAGVVKSYDSPIQDPGGRWGMYFAADNGRVIYAYNANASHNESTGVSTFHKATYTHGRATFYGGFDTNSFQFTQGQWVFSAGAYMMYWDGGTAHFGYNTNNRFNGAGGHSYFTNDVNVEGYLRSAYGHWHSLNGGWYTWPDFVFEHEYTGRIEKHRGAKGAQGYTGRMPLSELEAHVREHWKLPYHTGQNEVFTRADETLAELERLYLYLFEHEKRLAALEAR